MFTGNRAYRHLMKLRGGANVFIVEVPEKFCIAVAVRGRENSLAPFAADL